MASSGGIIATLIIKPIVMFAVVAALCLAGITALAFSFGSEW